METADPSQDERTQSVNGLLAPRATHSLTLVLRVSNSSSVFLTFGMTPLEGRASGRPLHHAPVQRHRRDQRCCGGPARWRMPPCGGRILRRIWRGGAGRGVRMKGTAVCTAAGTPGGVEGLVWVSPGRYMLRPPAPPGTGRGLLCGVYSTYIGRRGPLINNPVPGTRPGARRFFTYSKLRRARVSNSYN